MLRLLPFQFELRKDVNVWIIIPVKDLMAVMKFKK